MSRAEGVVTESPAFTAPGRTAAFRFIFAAALMDILAIGLIIPVLPDLVRRFTGGDTAQAAHYVGLFGLIFGLMQFIFSPIVGALSDCFGRRPVLLISIFGLGVDYVIMALAPSITWLFVAPFVRRFGERGALYTGLLAGAAGFALYGLATTGRTFALALPVFSLMGLVQPGYQGLMTRRVAQTEQGRLQGSNSGLMAIAGITGPLLFTGVFAWTVDTPGAALGPGTAVYLASAMLLVALGVAAFGSRSAA